MNSTPTAAPKKKEVIVTMAIGKKYLEEFNCTVRDTYERFAKKIDAELVVIEDYIKPSEKRAPWQKLLIFDHPRVKLYDRAMFMDADIFIKKDAKNPFDVVGNKPWAIADNNPNNFPDLATTDKELYVNCPPENRPERMMNTGVFIISKEYKPMLDYVYDHYKDQQCCDNGPLSYHLQNDGKGMILPPEFNSVVVLYRKFHGKGLSVILKMYDECNFIHFAAGGKSRLVPPLIRMIDSIESPFLMKIVRFIGHKRFDFITGPIIDAYHIISSAFIYHFKTRFLKKKK